MSLPSIQPPVRLLLRSRPDQLKKIHPSLDQADTKLVEKVCTKLCIADKTKVRRLITKVWIENKTDRVDIICDYGVPTNGGFRPRVEVYDISVDGPDLIISQLSNPHYRLRVNNEVEAWESLSLEKVIEFPGRTDVRESQRRQQRSRKPP